MDLLEKGKRLRETLEVGQRAGVSVTLLARTAGLSRQRVAQILSGSRNIR
jgi:plasmid maintenance system antidote protein VapI